MNSYTKLRDQLFERTTATKEPCQPATATIHFEPELFNKLNALEIDTEYADALPTQLDETLSIAALNKKFNRINEIAKKYETTKDNNTKSDEIKIILEQYRQAIIAATLESLRKFDPNLVIPAPPVPPAKKLWWVFGSLSFLGFIWATVDGFISSESLASIFPSISDPVLFGIMVGFSVISGLLFYGLEARSLKEELGLSNAGPVKPLLSSYEQQLEQTTLINEILFKKAPNIPSDQYRDYAELANSFHQNLLAKQNDFSEKTPEVSKTKLLARKAVGWLILGIGAILVAGTCFFEAKLGILAFFALSMSSPAGAAICALSIAIGLIFYYVLEKKGIFKLLNPKTKQLKNVKKKFASYTNDNKDFSRDLENHVKYHAQKTDQETELSKIKAENAQLQLSQQALQEKLTTKTLLPLKPARTITPKSIIKVIGVTKRYSHPFFKRNKQDALVKLKPRPLKKQRNFKMMQPSH